MTTTVPATLHILVTNDDGVGAPGIDAVVEALRALPDTEVTVVAPLENQSGTGGQTTPGTLTVTDTTTASGYPAKAVAGFPADSVIWAFDQAGVTQKPDLVVSGINFGQNLGPAVAISGTVGAAEAAAARGVPALAASQGLADVPNYPMRRGRSVVLARTSPRRRTPGNAAGVGHQPQRADLSDRCGSGCRPGARRSRRRRPQRCRRGLLVDQADFVDDIDAFINGYAVLSGVAA